MQNKRPSQTQELAPRGYEAGEPNFRGIFLVMAGVLIMGVTVFIGVKFFLRAEERRAALRDEVEAQAQVAPSVAASQTYFPYPREQPAPREDLEAYRARVTEELDSYGWVDRKTGIARIPIERAMDLIAQKGLPTRASNNSTNAGPSSLQLQQERAENFAPGGRETGK